MNCIFLGLLEGPPACGRVSPQSRSRRGTCVTTLLSLSVALAGCGSDFLGEDLPPGAFTTTDPEPGSSGGSTAGQTSDVSASSSSEDEGSTSTSEGSTTDEPSTSSTTGPDPTSSTSTTTSPTTTTTDEDTGTTTDVEEETTEVGPPAQCGDGTAADGEVCFEAPVTQPIGGTTPIDVTTGDFDDDGHADVATANASGTVSVLLGDGTGALGISEQFAVGTDPARIHASDLDGDADDDLVVVNRGSDTFSVLLSDGAGGFAAQVTYPVGDAPGDFGFGDLTGDGRDDVIVANTGSANLSTAVNNGSGVFTVLGPWASGGGVAAPAGAVLGQIAVGPEPDGFFVGGGSWGARPGTAAGELQNIVVGAPVGGAVGLRRASRGSVDGDPNLDAVAIADGGAYVFLDQNGQPAFGITALTTGANPSEAVLADVTGEGDADVVVSNQGSDTVGIYVGNGLAFAAAATVTLTVDDAPTGVAVVDLDEDGVRDIITAHGVGNAVNVLLSDP